jgi:hypothetical protein
MWKTSTISWCQVKHMTLHMWMGLLQSVKDLKGKNEISLRRRNSALRLQQHQLLCEFSACWPALWELDSKLKTSTVTWIPSQSAGPYLLVPVPKIVLVSFYKSLSLSLSHSLPHKAYVSIRETELLGAISSIFLFCNLSVSLITLIDTYCLFLHLHWSWQAMIHLLNPPCYLYL